MEQEKTIEEIKAEYEKFSKKNNLPDFEKLREDFDIDKILEKADGFLIRDIRRTITEKTSAYLHVFETFINPTSPPMFIFTFLKNLTEKDKVEIKEIYKELTKLQIENMKLDTIYDEKKEIDFIKKTFTAWQGLKKDIYSVIERFSEEFEKGSETKEKSYFG